MTEIPPAPAHGPGTTRPAGADDQPVPSTPVTCGLRDRPHPRPAGRGQDSAAVDRGVARRRPSPATTDGPVTALIRAANSSPCRWPGTGPGRRERWPCAPRPRSSCRFPRTVITENHPLAAELDVTPVSTSTTP